MGKPTKTKTKCKDGCTYSKSMDQDYPRSCIKCGNKELSRTGKVVHDASADDLDNDPVVQAIIKDIVSDDKPLEGEALISFLRDENNRLNENNERNVDLFLTLNDQIEVLEAKNERLNETMEKLTPQLISLKQDNADLLKTIGNLQLNVNNLSLDLESANINNYALQQVVKQGLAAGKQHMQQQANQQPPPKPNREQRRAESRKDIKAAVKARAEKANIEVEITRAEIAAEITTEIKALIPEADG